MDPEVVLMPQAHLSNVAEPRGHAALQEDILIRQTRFSYLILKGSLSVGCLVPLISPALEGLRWILGSKKALPENSRGLEQLLGGEGWCGGAQGLAWWCRSRVGVCGCSSSAPCSAQCSALCSELGILKLPKCELRPSSP